MFKGIIKGQLYWPSLTKTHHLSGKYQVTVGQLDKDLAKTLKEAGASVKKDEKMGYAITVKSVSLPEVKDSQLNVLPSNIVNTIGNGTYAEVSIGIVPSKFSNSAHYLNGIKILKLEARDGGGLDFEKTEGYVAPKTTEMAEVDDGEWEATASAT